MLACGGAVVWSLLLFPLLDTHSPVAFAVALIVTLGLQGIGYGPIGAFLPETFPPGNLRQTQPSIATLR